MMRNFFDRMVPYFIGIGASVGLNAFYMGIMTLTADWYYATIQFKEYQEWIVALSIGLGIQAFLFTQVRRKLIRGERKVARSTLVASGGLSTTSMVACCLHHLTEIIPFLGFPVLAVTLQKYQPLFFLAGVLSNFFGIVMMLHFMRKHEMIQIRRISILKRLNFIFPNGSF